MDMGLQVYCSEFFHVSPPDHEIKCRILSQSCLILLFCPDHFVLDTFHIDQDDPQCVISQIIQFLGFYNALETVQHKHANPI